MYSRQLQEQQAVTALLRSSLVARGQSRLASAAQPRAALPLSRPCHVRDSVHIMATAVRLRLRSACATLPPAAHVIARRAAARGPRRIAERQDPLVSTPASASRTRRREIFDTLATKAESTTSETMGRDIDLVIFGATGFTGTLVCEHIARDYSGAFKWAIAGRSLDKLSKLKQSLQKIDPGCDPEAILCDTKNQDAVDALVSRARVVICTAGPFNRTSRPVASACARLGTHYFDITGESHYVRWSIDNLDDSAKQSGARLVHMCGFDSVPSDIGTFHVVQHIRKMGLVPGRIVAMVGPGSGGVSGGTLASAVSLFEDLSMAELRSVSDPYYLVPDACTRNLAQHDHPNTSPERVGDVWVAPWVMGAVNGQVVRRSRAIMVDKYGPRFRYVEGIPTRWLLPSLALTLSLALSALAGITGLLKLLVWAVGPKQGEGPTREVMERGHWQYRFYAEATSPDNGTPRVFTSRVADPKRDPGYGSTSRMVLEAALCVVLNGDILASRGYPQSGVLTPASALGDVYVDRLVQAGLEFESVREKGGAEGSSAKVEAPAGAEKVGAKRE